MGSHRGNIGFRRDGPGHRGRVIGMITDLQYAACLIAGCLAALGVLALLVFASIFYFIDCVPRKEKIDPNIPRSSL
jgi:hypothetical protein